MPLGVARAVMQQKGTAADPNWAFVTAASSGTTYVSGVTANLSETFDAGTGSDRYLIVYPIWENGSDPAISAISYNGVSLTKRGAFTADATDNFNETIEAWTLAGPASGSNNLVFSNSASSQDFMWIAVVYSASSSISFVDVFTDGNVENSGNPAVVTFDTDITSPNMIAWAFVVERGSMEGTWTAEPDNTIRADDQTTTDTGAGFSTVAGDLMVGDGTVSIGATSSPDVPDSAMSAQLIAVELSV